MSWTATTRAAASDWWWTNGGTWFDVEPGTNPGFLHQQNTLRDALAASLQLDIFHRHANRVVMANIAQTVNVLQAVILTDGDQLILTPTYYVFEMNKGHHDGALLDVHLTSAPAERTIGTKTLRTLSMTASRKDDRALISVTNLDADVPRNVEIDLRGLDFEVGRARILNSSRLQDFNTTQQTPVSPQPFDAVTRTGQPLTIELPAHSFLTVEIELANASDTAHCLARASQA